MTVVLTLMPHSDCFTVVCGDWPDLRIEPDHTIEDLVNHLREYGPLSGDVTSALNEIGGQDLVDLWAKHVVGSHSAPLRSCPASVRAEVRRYAEVGISALDAPLWHEQAITVAEAGVAVARGLTVSDYRMWVDQYRAVLQNAGPRSFLQAPPVHGRPIDWIKAGVSIENFDALATWSVDPSRTGAQWESLIARFQVPRERLLNYLQARMSPEEVEMYEGRIQAGEDLDDTIAMLAAFAPKAVEIEAPF
ncbi:hypothetical protein [Nocardioides aromaticivorans]|nr:hypothetical protein [Nocardioides aromaticivorans]